MPSLSSLAAGLALGVALALYRIARTGSPR